ncbi:MAG: formamidopyrimidine-DNA glycosylase (fpg) [Acidobacteria bacterium]|nr:formamidopyrimidine-DNA glycosylase (fpg) [Acidobacteriota bacterium]
MPELPEVEHVVRALRGAITGRRIVTTELRLARIAPDASAAQFRRKLRGALIKNVSRRGKYILIELDNDRVLLTHLRMTGKFVSLTIDQILPSHAHVVFYLDDDRRLVFCDMRQFGRMIVVAKSKLATTRQLSELAPEPLSDDFSLEYLRAILARSHRSLKQLLLDQTKVLGLGNIYAAEALFLARISPFAVASKVSKQRALRLHEAIRKILSEAIEGGSTLRIDLQEETSSYIGTSERFWRVYEREGEPCVRCGTRIRRTVQGGRSTYFCSRCQRT